MKNNHHHTGNMTNKSTRGRPVFRVLGEVGAVILAGVALRAALAAGPEHENISRSKSQFVAENTGASNNHSAAINGIGFRSGTASGRTNQTNGNNPIAEKYNTLVMRVYFRDRVQRDQLAQELNA